MNLVQTADLELDNSHVTKIQNFKNKFKMADGHYVENRFLAKLSNRLSDCSESLRWEAF